MSLKGDFNQMSFDGFTIHHFSSVVHMMVLRLAL